jgi:hypothetical protein
MRYFNSSSRSLFIVTFVVLCVALPEGAFAQGRGGGGGGGGGGGRGGGGGAGGAGAGAGGARASGGGGAQNVDRSANANRAANTNQNINRTGNVNQNVNRNANVNQNVNVNRNVNVDVDNGCCGNNPLAAAAVVTAGVAVTAAAIGSIAYSIPPSCVPVSVHGGTYQQCGNTWYQPQYAGTQVTYVTVNPPY